MQLITSKLLPPSTFPSVTSTKARKHAYRLGAVFCPSMDLVATYPILTTTSSTTREGHYQDTDSEDEAAQNENGTTDDYAYAEGDQETVEVYVWRFNGQRVFSIAVEDDDGERIEIHDVRWRSDGKMMAVLSSDSVIHLVNTFSGKVVHRFSSKPTYAVPASPTSPRTRRISTRSTPIPLKSRPLTLSYTTHFSDPISSQSLLQAATAESSTVLDDLLALNADITSLLKSPADLPRELANLDVESILPRLSCLPPVGFGGEDIFSTRTSIDAIFHSSKKTLKSGIVEVLAAGSSDATVAIRIFDSFEIGGVDLNSANGIRKIPRLDRVSRITSWPLTSEVFVFAEDAARANLHLLSLDLKLITQNRDTLPIMATKATQLQNLLRYLSQIHSQLAREVKAAFDLPMRYLRNVNEDLEGQDGAGASFTTAAYHAIVTGEVSGAFKAWLNEQVGERGAKRWEKSVGDCLELVRRLVSEAWCPAVERAGVVASRLSGLAGWSAASEGDGPVLGLDKRLVEEAQDTIDVMTICGEECLKEVVREMTGFTSFIKWLKWEVEASALEDTSERLDEMRENSDYGDIMNVLDYIEQGPQDSVVKRYIQTTSSTTLLDPEDDVNLLAAFKEQRKRGRLGTSTPTFDQLLRRLRNQCSRLFEQIAQTLQKSIVTGYVAQLAPETDRVIMDVRAVPQTPVQNQQQHVQIHVISRKKDDHTFVQHQVVDTEGSLSKPVHGVVRLLQLPENEEVLDVKFVDDDCFMILGRGLDSAALYSHSIGTDQEAHWELRHKFEAGVMESGMIPARLEVNGRKKRRVVGVIDESGKGYVVFDLDSGEQEQDTVAEDEQMTG